MSSLRLHLNALFKARDAIGAICPLCMIHPRRKGVGCRNAILPFQVSKELDWVKEPLKLWGLGRIGAAGVMCCLKNISECETKTYDRIKYMFLKSPFLKQPHGTPNIQAGLEFGVREVES